MSKTILIHSFRHGVGRSNITANLAFILAAQGQRVGIIDTDTQVPAIHLFFGLHESEITYSFNDYLLGHCDIEQATHDVTANVESSLKGQIYLIPGNNGQSAPGHLNDAQDVNVLNNGCQRLIQSLNLNALLVDTQPGINKEALVAVTISDILVVVLRLNQHDYQGTSVTMDIVKQLDIPRITLIVNEAPSTFDTNDVKRKIEEIYECDVIAILPHVDEVTAMANRDLFARHHPRHDLTRLLERAAHQLGF